MRRCFNRQRRNPLVMFKVAKLLSSAKSNLFFASFGFNWNTAGVVLIFFLLLDCEIGPLTY